MVSVVIPCYNEEKNIPLLLDALDSQNYPHDLMEIVIVDGKSSDRSLDVITQTAIKFPDLKIRVLENPQRIIPAALNIGMRSAKGEIIVRMDAHSIPDMNYIRYCVENLEKNIASNVGGKWIIIPGSPSLISQCIAKAASHPFGVGDAKYRYSDKPGYVDTVPYGSFYKKLLDEVGYFNEELLANEDYEFNARIRKAGGKIYFDPRISTRYIARATLGRLSKQYFNYGFWKFKMLQKFPETLRLRQAIPPLFVAGIIILLLFSIFFPAFWKIIGTILLVYVGVLMAGAVKMLKDGSWLCLFGIPLAIIVMHFSWGAGFIFSIFSKKGKN